MVIIIPGSACDTAVERMPHNPVVVGSNLARCFAFFYLLTFPAELKVGVYHKEVHLY